MNLSEHRFFATEFKFLSSGDPGEFEGYGAVFGNVDSHGDMIARGAFTKTLAEHKSAGTMPGLYVEHSQYSPFGPAPLPVGVWKEMGEDDKGLRVKGKISALDTDHGRQVRSLMQDGAMRGLSIAYSVPAGGATINKKAADGQPRRVLNQLSLDAVDLVRSPSNSLATVESVKSLLALGDHKSAVQAVASAIILHKSTLAGSDSPSSDERAAMLQHLKEAHKALTGVEEPAAAKSSPKTIREFETLLREECGYTNAQARLIAENGFKSSLPRDGVRDKAANADVAALDEISASLRGFSLPKFF